MASVPDSKRTAIGIAHSSVGADFVGTPRVIAHLKGRGAQSNPEGRFELTRREAFDDGWDLAEDDPARPRTEVTLERAKSIISRNDSPDIPFDQSVNPYRGCEHGCVYCYARPTHSYLNLSPGLDFETRLFAKANAAELLEREIAREAYVPSPINLGANTDPYQPIERRHRITRAVIEVLAQAEHPLTIVTKSALVERDLDLLAPMAAKQLAAVFVSVTTLDNTLAAKLEPRASAPHRRIEAIRRIAAAGVPVGVFVAPVIPRVTDQNLEEILELARDAGASMASYTLVRLPHEVKDLFREWLATHLPDRAQHVMSLIQQMRGGADNDPRFGSRMRGEGLFAEILKRRFEVAVKRLGYAPRASLELDLGRFRRPNAPPPQGDLFEF
jgi:DNA repair photolyase